MHKALEEEQEWDKVSTRRRNVYASKLMKVLKNRYDDWQITKNSSGGRQTLSKANELQQRKVSVAERKSSCEEKVSTSWYTLEDSDYRCASVYTSKNVNGVGHVLKIII